MLEYKKGDIFDTEAEAIVNTVNCVGVMGRGIALQFKNVYPSNFKAYVSACKQKQVQPGKMFVYETGNLSNPKYIINFPTKTHWKGKSKMPDITAGLSDLVKIIRQYNIRSISIPPLGCGLGGLDWQEVRFAIESRLECLTDVSITIFTPNGSPEIDKIRHTNKFPVMTQGRAALIGLIDRYQQGLLDPFITLLEIHKLMYFMQEAEEPLRLQYKKAALGPFAENLGHVLKAMEGHYTKGYADGGDAPDKEIELLPDAVHKAKEFLQQYTEIQRRFERVADLVSGFEDSFGMELLATVHWIAVHEKAATDIDIIRKVQDWSKRKKGMFTEWHIRQAIQVLSKKNGYKETPESPIPVLYDGFVIPCFILLT